MNRKPQRTNSLSKVLSFALLWTLIGMVPLAAEETAQLETLTVTAQKQEENEMKVPISLTIFDSIELEDRGIGDTGDLVSYIPGFSSVQSNGLNGVINPNLRGVSSLAASSVSSVPLIIDGIPINSALGYDAALTNIERIEVLRGPQSTLYGKGAEVGAINVITRKPGDTLTGRFGVELGEDNKQEYQFRVSGPLIDDQLYFGVSGQYYQKDGFIENTYYNDRNNDKQQSYGKLQLRYLPTENMEISFISSLSKRDDEGRNSNSVRNGSSRVLASNADEFVEQEDQLHALKIDFDLGTYSLHSVTTLQDVTLKMMMDNDFTSNTISHMYKDMNRKKNTQEIRLNRDGENSNWLLGIYGDNESQEVLSITETAAMKSRTEQETKSRSLGVFAHTSYDLTSKWSINVGLRYDQDNQEYDSSSLHLESDYSHVTPKISLGYAPDHNVNLYATIAGGYNAGGFNSHSATNKKDYGQEELTSYEVGVKSILLAGRMSLSSALYYMDISNLQVLNYTSMTSYYLTNAASAASKGMEVELDYRISNNIRLMSGFSLNETKFTDYSDFKDDYTGNYNPNAPKMNYNVGIQYRAEGGMYARTDVVGYGDMYTDNANDDLREAYSVVNARIGYEWESFEVYLYANNLFDEKYDSVFNSNFIIYSEPREIGGQLAYRF